MVIPKVVVLKNTYVSGVAKQEWKKYFLLKGVLNLLGFLSGRLLGEKNRVDIGENTTLRDGDTAKKLVKFLIVADGKLDVTGDNAALLIVAGSIASKLKDLGSEVLKHRGKVHGGTSSNSGGISALLQVSSDTSNGELKTSLGRRGG
jgi:hypothetical protein